MPTPSSVMVRIASADPSGRMSVTRTLPVRPWGKPCLKALATTSLTISPSGNAWSGETCNGAMRQSSPTPGGARHRTGQRGGRRLAVPRYRRLDHAEAAEARQQDGLGAGGFRAGEPAEVVVGPPEVGNAPAVVPPEGRGGGRGGGFGGGLQRHLLLAPLAARRHEHHQHHDGGRGAEGGDGSGHGGCNGRAVRDGHLVGASRRGAGGRPS